MFRTPRGLRQGLYAMTLLIRYVFISALAFLYGKKGRYCFLIQIEDTLNATFKNLHVIEKATGNCFE